ncbi:hypothetical protein V5J35_001308 [Endozoicomonas sp. NE40]|uniref:RING-type domain-containing protein n=1 Tax=Endozoicomonas lisbonensis TaxID=3120522 RepID=A0ABV2SEE2_9GAMM
MKNATICLNDLEGDITILMCGHYYHYDCIHLWLDTYLNSMCPLCRHAVSGRPEIADGRLEEAFRVFTEDLQERANRYYHAAVREEISSFIKLATLSAALIYCWRMFQR